MRNLGVMGQSTVASWCAQVGLVANPSTQDLMGWDTFIQFPYQLEANSHFSMDSIPMSIECKVQVKATDGQAKKCQITLSNLLNLAKSPTPSFYLFIEYFGKNEPQSAYLVHVDCDLISKTLKAIRKNDQKNNPKKTNDIKMLVYYGASHRLSGLNGDSLKKAIESYVRQGMEIYCKKKIEHLRKAGYEGGGYKGTFATSSLEDLVNLSVGIVEKVEITNVKMFDNRFGIIGKDPLHQAEKGVLGVPDLKPSKGRIIFKEDLYSHPTVFKCDVYSSYIVHDLPQNLKKIRFKGAFFDFIFFPFKGGSKECIFNFSFDRRLQLQEMHEAFEFIRKSQSSSPVQYLSLECGDKKIENIKIQSFDASVVSAENAEIVEYALFLQNYFVLDKFSSYHLEDLINSANDIKIFYAVANSKFDSSINVNFELQEGAFDPEKIIVVLFPMSIFFGDYQIIIVVSFLGCSKKEQSGRWSLETKEIKIEKKYIVDKNSCIDEKFIHDDVARISEKYIQDEVQVVRFDS